MPLAVVLTLSACTGTASDSSNNAVDASAWPAAAAAAALATIPADAGSIVPRVADCPRPCWRDTITILPATPTSR